ncbi:MAG TPA: class I SAM-dependent methyltransferase [Desulfuromonadales bacterium]|nr:class I SAM-dependent methyltransferase [Desulfuromonadales bacterium]
MKYLYDKFIKKMTDALTSTADSDLAEDTDTVLFGLDTPPIHLVNLGATTHFSGSVVEIGNRSITDIRIYCDGKHILTSPVNIPRELIGKTIPHIRNAATCGFEFDMMIDAQAECYDFELVFSDGTREQIYSYDITSICENQTQLERMRKALDQLPMPDGQTIFLTQGHTDVQAYKNSIIPFIVNVTAYMTEAGLEISTVRSVLDIGCGSGRILAAWHLDDSSRRLVGCDINYELITWARNNMPAGIEFLHNKLHHRLPLGDACFDMIQLLSVFTHLSLQSQQELLREMYQHLNPNGHLLITLHGHTYIRLFMPDRNDEFISTGYIETTEQDEGSNQFGTYHSYKYAEALFDAAGFEIAGYYPMGKIRGKRITFQIASLQDVYLLKRTC